jgi:hypothetical protein
MTRLVLLECVNGWTFLFVLWFPDCIMRDELIAAFRMKPYQRLTYFPALLVVAGVAHGLDPTYTICSRHNVYLLFLFAQLSHKSSILPPTSTQINSVSS